MIPKLLCLITALIIAMLLRFPVYIALLISTITFAAIFPSVMPIEIIAQGIASGLNNTTMAAIAFFFLSGEIMSAGGISKKIIKFFSACIGHVRGGLSHVNVLESIVFAGTSGSAIADTVATSAVLVPAMKESGYPADYSMAITLATSCIGPIIPPSTGLVLLAIYTGANPNKVLMAGLLPGILMGIVLLIMSYIICKKRNYPKDTWRGFGHLWRTTKETILAMLMPVIIILGLGFGIGSINEVGAAACVYGIIVSCLIYRDLDYKGLCKAILAAGKSMARIMCIIAACGVFNWIIASIGMRNALVELMGPFVDRPLLLMFVVLLIFIFAGMFIEQSVNLWVITPLMAPMVTAAGFPIETYCVMAMMACTLGLITPPVGTLIYIGSSISHEKPQKIVRQLMPFIAAILIVLVLLIFFPQIAAWLPEVLY